MRKLYACAILMAMSVAVSAQTEQKSVSGYAFVVPKLFAYGDNSYVVAVDDKEVAVYNDDIELVRSFNVNLMEYTTGRETLERKAVVTIESVEVDGYVEDEITGEVWTGTWDEARESLSDVEVKDNYQLWPTDKYEYMEYERYGKLYPIFYYQWNVEDGTISRVFVDYHEAFTGEWETVSGNSYKSSGEMQRLYFKDYDDNTHPDQGFYLSQTLFNADEKFEYVESIYEVTDYIYNELDRDGDGEIDYREFSQRMHITGFRIVSEDGTLLQTINSTGYVEGVFKINGKIYMVADGDDDERIFFKIDRQTSSITRVAEMPVPAKSFFSLSGRKLPSAQRGINIVHNSDGSSSKFIKK